MKLILTILWRLGVPLQCRAKNEGNHSWYDMVKSDWPSCYSITTKWDFKNWDYRIRPIWWDERFKCV